MFSTLGGIFTPRPARQAEQTDTRQDIQRHDPDQPQRRKSRAKDEDATTLEDGATVAVLALREFLENFIKSAAPATQSKPPASENISVPTQAASSAENNPQTDRSAYTARAASAYQNTPQSARREPVLLETTDSASGGPEFDLSASDTRAIHTLIEELKVLAAAEIEYIHIERAETFLQSLINGVNAAKAQLP
jgi:hypothetical protein